MIKPKLNRRKFLKRGSAAVLGAGILGSDSLGAASDSPVVSGAAIKDYRKFGRTGFMVSDISCGTFREDNVLKAMLEKGANLIETGEVYSNGNHERQIGNILKDYDRSKLFIVSKIHSRSGPITSRAEVKSRFYNSLERLQTGYIDGYMIHSALSSDEVKNRHFHAAMKELKKEGKVRFTGVSCHGSSYFDNPEESMEQVLGTAIEDGRFDFMELIYNFFEPDMGTMILEKCGQNNIGTMIMKSSPIYIYDYYRDLIEKAKNEGTEITGSQQRYFDKYSKQAETAEKFFARYGISDPAKIREAALQFILTNNNVSTIPAGILNYNDVDFYLNVSGKKLDDAGLSALNGFSHATGFLNCRIGCDICEAKCPHNLPVNTILRYNYYFQAKKEEKNAMNLYAALQGRKPDVCRDCPGYCEDACPYGVMTRGLLSMARQNLSFIKPSYT